MIGSRYLVGLRTWWSSWSSRGSLSSLPSVVRGGGYSFFLRLSLDARARSIDASLTSSMSWAPFLLIPATLRGSELPRLDSSRRGRLAYGELELRLVDPYVGFGNLSVR